MQDCGKIGNCPSELERRLIGWLPLDEADCAALRSLMDGDPRIAALLLGRMEYPADPNSISKVPASIVSLLLENQQTRDAALFALRSGAYQSSGEMGLTTEIVLPLFNDSQEREQAYRWSFFRLARLDCWRFLEDHPDFSYGEHTYSVMLWIAARALEDATWVPLLLVMAKRWKHGCKELLIPLAVQPEGSLGEFDVGDLEAPLGTLRCLVEGISDPIERVKHLASAIGYSHPDLLLEPMVSAFPTENHFDHGQVGREAEGSTSDLSLMDPSQLFLGRAGGFEKWFQAGEERRQLAMKEVVGAKGDVLRTECVDHLAFWFGEHPDTFQFLAGVVMASSRMLSDVGSPERIVRSHCMKIIGLRWPGDDRTYVLAKEALDHPWREVRRAAALLLCREHAGRSETEGLIADCIGNDAILFGEFTVLVRERHEGMASALKILEQVGTGAEFEAIATDGPAYLVSSFGPRKDLRESLASLSSRTSNEDLKGSIARVIEVFFK